MLQIMSRRQRHPGHVGLAAGERRERQSEARQAYPLPAAYPFHVGHPPIPEAGVRRREPHLSRWDPAAPREPHEPKEPSPGAGIVFFSSIGPLSVRNLLDLTVA